MTTEEILKSLMIGTGTVLFAWLLACTVRRLTSGARRADPFLAADNAPIIPGDQLGQLRAEMRRERRPASPSVVPEREHLPSAAERTDMMAALRSDCPSCGTDHIGACAKTELLPELVTASVAVDEYITGEIVSRDHTDIDMTSVIQQRLDEFHSEWHRVGDEWHPPTALTDTLDADDWLRLLLEQELVPA